jgi:hypothetical protein
VLGLALFRGGAVKLAAGVYEPAGGLGLVAHDSVSCFPVRLQGVEQVATCITLPDKISNREQFESIDKSNLVATSALVVADAALALDIAVGQEG